MKKRSNVLRSDKVKFVIWDTQTGKEIAMISNFYNEAVDGIRIQLVGIESIKCPHCGNYMPNDANYCSQFRTKLSK